MAERQIHINFPQIIEQNFARLNEGDMNTLIDALSEQELSDLAQLYSNATTDTGHPTRLFQVFAHRLDSSRLGRLSKHFGFSAIYGAVVSISPNKTEGFLASSQPSYSGPIPGQNRFGPNGKYSHSGLVSINVNPERVSLMKAAYFEPTTRLIKVGNGQFLNYTPYEIYLSFRTSPIGALGVTASLYETSLVLSTTLAGAYGTGYAIGTYVVAPLIQTYAPSLWDRIGNAIGGIVDKLTSAPDGTAANGKAQQSAAQPDAFGLSNSIGNSIGRSGGDYESAADWTDYGGYSNGSAGCSPMNCFKGVNAS